MTYRNRRTPSKGWNGLPYLVMEYVNGISLQDRLDQSGPLELKEVLRIGLQAACGLAAAHKQGLIHRDIKPANILLENGVQRVKITDFGLARAVDDASLTQSGVIAGTPQYMAPEQARGEPVDHRSDLFSLGSVLYAMCTGRAPFRASTTMAVLKRVCEESPRPIREINPDIPDWLCAIIEKLHAKDPADRFHSAGEVAELLAQHLAHLQQPERVPRPPAVQVPPAEAPQGFSLRQFPLAAWIGCGLWASVFLMALVEVQEPAAARFMRGIGTLLTAVTVLYAAVYIAWAYARWSRTTAEPRPYRIALFLGIPSVATLFFLFAWVEKPVRSVRDLLVGNLDHGIVLIEADDPELVVTLDDRLLPVTPLGGAGFGAANEGWLFGGMGEGVPPGTHRVIALKQGKVIFDETFTLAVGETKTIKLSSPKDRQAGWVPLFNGKDLTGWNTPWPDLWAVEHGVLVSRIPQDAPKEISILTSRDEFADFHLRVEAKINAEGDSGIVFRRTEKFNGYQAQINERGPVRTRTGSLYKYRDVLQEVSDSPIAPDTWFTMEVICHGPRIVIKIDGRTVVDRVDAESVPGTVRGHIGLETGLPGTVVHFRKIEIKELPPPETPNSPQREWSRRLDLTGYWLSDWGEVTLEHPPIEGGAKVAVSGKWNDWKGEVAAAGPFKGQKTRGQFDSAFYDPAKGVIAYKALEQNRDVRGVGELRVIFDGTAMVGFWTGPDTYGTWTLWRKGRPRPTEWQIAGDWDSDFGVVTIAHDKLWVNGPMPVRGSLLRLNGKRVPFAKAEMNPTINSLRLEFDTFDDKKGPSMGHFLLSPDGQALVGIWTNSAGACENWALRRQKAPDPLPDP
ncbi:MAG TPA: family 16 glycoside hydrolase [Gemmataceae bacterium]|nr:family 16 glycoside hydrolase [Gemmataceae bacterium]